MFFYKLTKKASVFVAVLGLILSVFSCSDDDSGSVGSTSDNPYVLSLAVLGSDNTYTYYTAPFDSVMSGSLSVEGIGIEQPGYYDFTQIDETIYSIGGLDDVDVVGINYNKSTGSLTEIGNVSYTNSLSDIVKGDDNTLVAVSMSSSSDMIDFYQLDVNTVTQTSSTSVAVSSVSNFSVPTYSGMVVNGDYLYLSYYISDPSTYATNYTDTARIAVFSYPDLEFQGNMKDTRTGPIGGFNTKCGLVKDEDGDIYALSHSNPANGFSQTTKNGAILKINSGETAFDEDYFFNVEEATGGYNIAHLQYLGDGIAFAEVNMLENSAQTAWSDSPLQSAIVDLYNQKVTFIDDVPEHSGDGRRLPALYDDGYVYLCIPEDSGIFVYKIDIDNVSAERGAEVEASFVAGFFRL